MMRSYLFVPGDQPDKIAKAAFRGADALIFDLEDAVLPNRKNEARDLVASAVANGAVDMELWVRINNHPDLMAADIASVVPSGPTGLVIPKVADVQTVTAVVEHVKSVGPRSDEVDGPIHLMVMIEDGQGVMAMEEIANADRVRTMMIGEYDLAVELGIEPSEDGREFLYVHSKLIAACAAAGINPPVAPVTADFGDMDELRASTTRFRKMGYFGRAVIHPAQISVANAVFTSSEAEVLEAKNVIATFEAGRVDGAGAIDAGGSLIDAPIVRAARRVLGASHDVADS